ncbi:MAG TPA: LCP family protein [Candidatus Limnocylindria bacterium]|nr:LCP family protein [Candidatus Limnocylindria bacterium]
MLPERPSRQRALITIALLATLLLAACGQTPTPTPLALPSASPTPPEPTPTAEPTATPVPTPTPNPFDQEMIARRYTVLVIGEDSNARREARGHASRTDAIMVVSLSPRQTEVTMLSLPRDTVDIPMANGTLYTGKVNGIAYQFGYEALQGAMETMLDIHIHAYVKVDMDNFVQLVDAVGGVKVTNPAWLVDGHLGLSLAPGTQRLDGETALDYVRSRYTSSDYARAARQQQVLLSLVRKYLNPATEWNLDQVLLMLDSLQTNIDFGDLPTLMEMARRSRKAAVVTTVLTPPRFSLGAGDFGDGRGWVIIPNLAEMRAYAHSLLRP